jgi:hypothetical protein
MENTLIDMNEEIPVFKAKLGKIKKGESAMLANSIVDNPAIMRDAMMFNNQENTLLFSANIDDNPLLQFKAGKKKGYFTGISMVPNLKMKRIDNQGNEYFIYFDEATIEEIRNQFMSSDNIRLTRANHEGEYTDKNILIETWLVEDPENDKLNALGFKNLEKGMLATTYLIKDKEMLIDIEDGKLKGFSIEVMVDLEPVEMKKENFNEMKKEVKDTYVSKMKQAFAKFQKQMFDEVVGEDAEVTPEVGATTDATDGDHVVVSEDGEVAVATVEDGTVTDVNEEPSADEILAIIEEALNGAVEEMKKSFKKRFEKDEEEEEDMKAVKTELSALKSELARLKNEPVTVENFKSVKVKSENDVLKNFMLKGIGEKNKQFFNNIALGAAKNQK